MGGQTDPLSFTFDVIMEAVNSGTQKSEDILLPLSVCTGLKFIQSLRKSVSDHEAIHFGQIFHTKQMQMKC